MMSSCILEHRSNDSFDIVVSMGMPASSIYMSHIYCISPIDGNQINTKTKSHHAPALEAPPLNNKSYDVHRPYVELLPSHIRGQSVNSKIPHIALNGLHHPRTPSHNTHFTHLPLKPPTLPLLHLHLIKPLLPNQQRGSPMKMAHFHLSEV